MSVKCRVEGGEWRVWSVNLECGVWSEVCKVWSLECRVWKREPFATHSGITICHSAVVWSTEWHAYHLSAAFL